ncbi:MAG: AarF/ABC1/UbiB kinase family protein [Methanocalculus sp.]|uniref:ABC1 kinase family protein n=1 Tax=Methanocalculus sp. TaxID=2004547 RepID=UPI00271DDB6A|nr:AarF/ABC1/UbiB kinase family protein [Methanocalculus sp.]MDO9539520.1 AarF/ABC1/UbiB kinase family protein [Methanocalculus sp.]
MLAGMKRYGQIADILVKHGFGIAVDELFPGLPRRGIFKGRGEEPVAVSVSERIRLALEELGPTFIKFGQIMSTRRELFPPDLIDELLKLQDRVPALPFSQVQCVLDEGIPNWNELFLSIDPVPIAAASLSQVHRGLLSDGTVVAVKIQRPDIEELIETDLLILSSLAERLEVIFPDIRIFNPIELVRDFSRQIRKELDFTRDGKNAERIRRNMATLPGISVPKIFWEASSRRVLTMEYIKGVRIDNTESIRGMGLWPKEIAQTGFSAYLKQILVDGFFHGDPHPGNLLVMKNGDLVFLDFGICMVLRPKRRDMFIRLLHGIVENDVDECLAAFSDLGVAVSDNDKELFRDDLFLMLLDYTDYEVRQYDFSKMATELAEILRKYQIRVPGELMRLMKVIGMVGDIALSLDPSFCFSTRVRPYLAELLRERYFSSEALKNDVNTGITSLRALLRIPDQMNAALKRVSEGRVRIDVVADDIRRLQETFDRSADRMMVGLITSSVVIGSSLLLLASGTTIPYVHYVAIIGYTGAVIVGIYAVIHAIRISRKASLRRRS